MMKIATIGMATKINGASAGESMSPPRCGRVWFPVFRSYPFPGPPAHGCARESDNSNGSFVFDFVDRVHALSSLAKGDFSGRFPCVSVLEIGVNC